MRKRALNAHTLSSVMAAGRKTPGPNAIGKFLKPKQTVAPVIITQGADRICWANRLRKNIGIEMPSTFLINSPPITHQTIDGEVVIINLNNGSYYSLRDSAAVIWALVEAGADTEQIIRFCSDHYAEDPDFDSESLQSGIRSFLDALCGEDLVQRTQHSSAGPTGQASLASSAQIPSGQRFSQPIFEKYDDLQDLVMLDPIHQVSERGWPHPKEDT